MAGSVLDLVGKTLAGRIPVQSISDVLSALQVQSSTPALPDVDVGELIPSAALPVLPGLPSLPLPPVPIPYALRLHGPAGAPDGFTLDILIGSASIDVPALGAHLGGKLAIRIEAEPGQSPISIRPFAAPTSNNLLPLPVALPAVELALNPAEIPIGGVFKLTLSSIRVEPANGGGGLQSVRVVIPSAELKLPWVPMFGALAVHIADLALDPLTGLSGTSTVSLPHPSLGSVNVDIDWDQPSARSLEDLIPSSVRLSADVPQDLTKHLPSTGGSPGDVGTHAAGGGGVKLVASIGPVAGGESRAAIQIDATGSPDGLLLVDEEPASTILSIALFLASGVIGPLPPVGSGAAGLAAMVAAAVPLEQVAIGGKKILHDGRVAVQAVRIDAPLGDGAHPPQASVDVSAALSVEVPLGPMLRIFTRPEGPLRVRYRDIKATIGDGSPGSGDIDSAAIDFADVQPELESPGSWVVEGLGDLLRVAGVRNGAGSSWFEIDLVLGIDLGLIKVDTATVRVTMDGAAPAVEMRGLGVSISVPGILEGSGAGRIATGQIEAEASARLPSIGLAAAASFVYAEDPNVAGRPLVKVEIDVAFPGPLPLGSTGLGLFGIGGLFAMNAQRKFSPSPPSPDPVEREFEWARTHGFEPGDGVAFGARAVIGTIPDLGFSFNALGSLVIVSPEVTVIVGLDVHLLSSLPKPGDNLPPAVGVGIEGLLVVDGKGVLIGARGSFVVPGLLDARLPVGAFFGFTDPKWFIRIGADGHGNPIRGGGPISIAVLPDLIDLSAWAYIMLEGDGLLDMGGKLQVADHGFAIGFGVGWDIEWFAFPLHFEATGEVLVGMATSPWALVGHAMIGGSLDLGPVSLSLSASLDIEVGDGRALHAHGEFCGYVDLFFFEVGGCIGIDIGPKPAFPIPPAQSPLMEVSLVDRTGKVIQPVAEGGGPGPTVWPDAVPVLTFNTWIDTTLAGGPFQKHLVGQPPPPIDGWTGSQDLGYRFELTKLELTATKNGQTTDVTDDLFAAWSLPKHGVPYGSPGVPPVGGARELNLLTWENALWARSLIDGGASTPGDPTKSVGAPCADPPSFDCTVLLGTDAHVMPGGFGWGSKFQIWRVLRHEFDAFARWSVGALGVLDAQTAPAKAADLPGRYEPGGVRKLPGPLPTSEGEFVGTWDLPLLRGNGEIGDQPHEVVIIPSVQLDDAVLVMDIDPIGTAQDHGDDWRPVRVSGISADDGTTVPWVITTESGEGAVHRVDIARPPDHRLWSGVVIGYDAVSRPGILALKGCAWDVVSDRTRDADARAKQNSLNTELVTSALPMGRSLLEEGTTYALTVGLSSRARGGSPHQELPAAAMTERTFTFTTAKAEAYGDPNAQGYLKLLHHAHNSFDAHALVRYVRDFHPTGISAFHFTKDPIGVDLSVDYLEQLVNIYGGSLRIRARRVDPVPGTPPFQEPGDDDGLIKLFAPFYPWLIDAVDANLMAAASLAACPTPVGGGVTAAAFPDLDPRAQYESALVAIPTPGGDLAKATVSTGFFSTSAYATPDALIAAMVGAAAAIGDVEIDEPAPGVLAGLGGQGDDAFERVLFGLGLDPWPVAHGPRVSRLWVNGADDKWRCAGILVELDEPLVRPNRLDQFSLTAPGSVLRAPIMDGLGTRLAFLPNEPFEPSAGNMTLSAISTEPWTGAPPRSVAASAPMSVGPAWAGELQA